MGRSIYYTSRLISVQKDQTFINTDYQDLRKVYSIWILSNPGTEYRNTINLFTWHHTPVIGSNKYSGDFYDKMSVVLINLPQQKETDRPLLSFLSILLSRK